jgi:hypothetical protein
MCIIESWNTNKSSSSSSSSSVILFASPLSCCGSGTSDVHVIMFVPTPQMLLLMVIAAVPIIKLFARGEGDSGGQML